MNLKRVLIVAMLVLSLAMCQVASADADSEDPWFDKLVGERVVVTLNQELKDIGSVIDGELIGHYPGGVVLRLEDESMFFSFAVIAIIEEAKEE